MCVSIDVIKKRKIINVLVIIEQSSLQVRLFYNCDLQIVTAYKNDCPNYFAVIFLNFLFTNSHCIQ